MLSVAVQKDIGEYREKVILGLSGKTLLGVALGIGASAVVALIGYFGFGLSVNDLSLPVLVLSGSGFLIGYCKPLNLPFEKALPLILKEYFGQTCLVYKSSLQLARKAAIKAEKDELAHPAASTRGERKERKQENKDVCIEKKKYNAERSKRGVSSPEYCLPRYRKAEESVYKQYA
jgi:hypothetical protein